MKKAVKTKIYVFTRGEYSDFSISGVFIGPELDLEECKRQFVEARKEFEPELQRISEKSEFEISTLEEFDKFLIKKFNMQPADGFEWWTGAYGSPVELTSEKDKYNEAQNNVTTLN